MTDEIFSLFSLMLVIGSWPVSSNSKLANSLSWTLIMLTTSLCLFDKEESFCTALAAMDEEASKFGLHISWTKTKLQNLGSGSAPLPTGKQSEPAHLRQGHVVR